MLVKRSREMRAKYSSKFRLLCTNRNAKKGIPSRNLTGCMNSRPSPSCPRNNGQYIFWLMGSTHVSLSSLKTQGTDGACSQPFPHRPPKKRSSKQSPSFPSIRWRREGGFESKHSSSSSSRGRAAREERLPPANMSFFSPLPPPPPEQKKKGQRTGV